ncbi:PREDICTED: NAC domain-containing protein 30-like [Camelina sativa]|uniref:NAC domain-containing protein 30-like n=1 Tax=Camelina sativa TaxID=90675 RepID=A0ABM0VC76_CAMSA|nr:PREDICTED: NAC domain-containing protein 30-like [Camelina sativa]
MSTVEKYNENEQQEEFVGFRFHPTDQELVRYCLGRNKVAKTSNKVLELEDKTDLYAKEPWRLTHTETDFFEPNEWYYFVTLAENVTGKLRTSRKVKGETCEGCWKEVLGKLSDVLSEDKREVIGKKRSLSFYVKGESISSGWTMTEYYSRDGGSGSFQNQVLCHLKGP